MSEEKEKEVAKNTAYFNARREWNERYGSYIKSANTWKAVAFLSLALSLVSVSGLAVVASQNKLVPYIVEVDKLGNSVAAAPAIQIEHTSPKVIKYSLAEFIKNFRTIYGDTLVQKETVLKAYRYLSPSYPSFNIVNNYFRENSPFKRLAEEIVHVNIDSIIARGDKVWQIDWHENVFDKKGNKLRTDYFRASVTILIVPPKNETEILKNPIGLYITEFDFSKIIK